MYGCDVCMGVCNICNKYVHMRVRKIMHVYMYAVHVFMNAWVRRSANLQGRAAIPAFMYFMHRCMHSPIHARIHQCVYLCNACMRACNRPWAYLIVACMSGWLLVTYACVRACVCLCTRVCVCVCARMHTNIHTCISVMKFVHIGMYVCMCACMCM